jgi:hypothetical protein
MSRVARLARQPFSSERPHPLRDRRGAIQLSPVLVVASVEGDKERVVTAPGIQSSVKRSLVSSSLASAGLPISPVAISNTQKKLIRAGFLPNEPALVCAVHAGSRVRFLPAVLVSLASIIGIC